LTAQKLQFLLRVAPPALASQSQYEIPACVTIAQAILESGTPVGWGSSALFRLANNPFGIKQSHFGAGGWGLGTGENHNTQPSAPGTLKVEIRELGAEKENSKFKVQNSKIEVQNPEAYGHFDAAAWEIEIRQKKATTSQYRRFANLEEAFITHARLLCSPRYWPAFAARAHWKEFAERLGPKVSEMDTEHCGYSTNPSYSAEIISLVGRYRLNDPRALQWLATGKDPGAATSYQQAAASSS
jgi:flagellum-specific peptidoglycan hydrolase FlgJ